MGRRRWVFAGGLVAVVSVALALGPVAAVGSGGKTAPVAGPYFVVGDSTHDQIAAAVGAPNATTPGCGYTGESSGPYVGCRIDISPVPAGVGRVIAGVAIVDTGAADLSAYSDVTAYYRAQGVTVTWVAVPPVNNRIWTVATITAHNAAVAAELGCDLADHRTRDAATTDGIHYTDQAERQVAHRYAHLPGPVC